MTPVAQRWDFGGRNLMTFTYCIAFSDKGNKSTDYPHPLDWFDVLLNGDRITSTHNNNYSNFNDPAVNKEIGSLKQQPTLSRSVIDRWAALDQKVMQEAAWAPYINRQFTDFFSSKIDTSCYVNHVLYQFDFSRICMK